MASPNTPLSWEDSSTKKRKKCSKKAISLKEATNASLSDGTSKGDRSRVLSVRDRGVSSLSTGREAVCHIRPTRQVFLLSPYVE